MNKNIVNRRKRRLIDIINDYLKIRNKNKTQIDILKLQQKNIKKYENIAVPAFDYISSCIILDGQYEKMELNSIARMCKKKLKNKTVLDIGAHIGNHSIFFSKYAKKVISFEPNSFTYKFLKFNSEFYNNIITLNFGASNVNSKMQTITNINNLGTSRVYKKKSTKKNKLKKEISNFKKLDDLRFLFKEKIALIKLDVENHEIQALNGMKRLLKKNFPIVIFECSYNQNDENIYKLLKELGYRKLYVCSKPKWATSEKLPFYIKNFFKILEAIFFKAPEYKYNLLEAKSLNDRAAHSHFALMSLKKI